MTPRRGRFPLRWPTRECSLRQARNYKSVSFKFPQGFHTRAGGGLPPLPGSRAEEDDRRRRGAMSSDELRPSAQPHASSRCSTARPASTSWSRRRPSWACRPSPSPTTGSCSAPWTSTQAAPATRRQADHRASRPTSRPARGSTASAGENEEKYRHLTLLARNEAGYRNLLQARHRRHLEGFYHRPRIDKELLAERAEGLIGLSGLPGRRDARACCWPGQRPKARRWSATYRDIFGPGAFYLELQDHGLAEQRAVNPMLVELSAADRRSRWRPPTTSTTRERDRRAAARRPAVHPAAEGPDATRAG